MKYVLVFIMVIHGLIHLMGFSKAFNDRSFEQLQTPISQPMGFVWLAAALLFLLGAVLLFAAPSYWWLPAFTGVVVSQIVIFAAWNDAKFGTFANLIVLVPVVIGALEYAPWSFRSQYQQDVARGLASTPNETEMVTEANIAHLPPVVQKYLHFAGVVGNPQVSNYHLRFQGALRNGPDDGWNAMEAHQQSFVEPAERLFVVDMPLFGVPATAYHRYIGSQATFEVKVASLVEVVDARGPEMNQSETVTLFNDMCLLAPATLIDPRIRWEVLDLQTVRATFTNAGNTISAVLSFDSSGALTNFVSDDRSRTLDGKTYEHVRWSTPITGWHTFDGRKLPDAEAHWLLPSGEFAYGRFTITEAAYNVLALE